MIRLLWLAALLLSINEVPPITPKNVDQITIVNRLELGDTSAQAIAFNPLDSHELALAQSNGFVSLWDIAAGEREAEWQVAQTSLRAIAYLPTGKSLVTMDDDGKVAVWDSSTHEKLRTLVIEGEKPVAFDTSPNNLIAIGYEDGNVRLWNTDKGKNILTLYGSNSRIQTLDISVDGRRIAFGYSYGTVIIYRIDDIESEHVYIENVLHADELNALIFHPGTLPDEYLGEAVLATVSNFISVQFWDVQYDGVLSGRGKSDAAMAYPYALTFNHEGSLLAIAGKATAAGGWCESNLCPVEIISAHYQQNTSPSGHPVLMSFDVPGATPLDISFSPDDRYLASSFGNKEVLIWAIAE